MVKFRRKLRKWWPIFARKKGELGGTWGNLPEKCLEMLGRGKFEVRKSATHATHLALKNGEFLHRIVEISSHFPFVKWVRFSSLIPHPLWFCPYYCYSSVTWSWEGIPISYHVTALFSRRAGIGGARFQTGPFRNLNFRAQRKAKWIYKSLTSV